ncbi:hypothetical protein RRG08_027455 [Elysia crispata]|uniref:Uncharacterized protein n=1 Tax=Elysia crispata TaxID=231223 RepID=A0AAE0YR87_9GAST|nr:hypothetical protein RRG08_027455 [Elysia crispata]
MHHTTEAPFGVMRSICRARSRDRASSLARYDQVLGHFPLAATDCGEESFSLRYSLPPLPPTSDRNETCVIHTEVCLMHQVRCDTLEWFFLCHFSPPNSDLNRIMGSWLRVRPQFSRAFMWRLRVTAPPMVKHRVSHYSARHENSSNLSALAIA